MIQAAMHMHTCFSTDSQACPRDMAEEAVRNGVNTICFTEHFDKDELDWGEEGIFDVDAYFTEMQKLQEEYEKRLGSKDYRDSMEISTPNGTGSVEKSQGNLMYESTDFSIPSLLLNLELTRTYNSQSD